MINTYTYLFLTCMILGFVIQCLLTRRHINHVQSHCNTVPEAFSDKIPLEAHQKAANYTQAKVKTGLYEFILSMAFLLIWTLGGGLQLLDKTWRSTELAELWIGVGFILSAFAIMSLLELPISAYRTFGLEQRFGFNRSTPKIFITDLIKNVIVAFVIGTPMIMLILWIMASTGNFWWLYVWITWLCFSLFMMWAYPVFIAPLFNKYRPLENQELCTRIENLLSRNGFTSNGIFVMDGSSRSTHGNAYFTGLGANKRIVFFDTLIDELSMDEIEAVLAHELGHFKCNHIKKRITVLSLVFFAGLALLGWLINEPEFYTGLGVSQSSNYMALILFVMVSPVFTYFLQPLFSHISRKHEFEADDFAAAQAQTGNLIQALVKLYKENANTLTPDPMYSAFHDSHPPAPIRIAHLSAKLA